MKSETVANMVENNIFAEKDECRMGGKGFCFQAKKCGPFVSKSRDFWRVALAAEMVPRQFVYKEKIYRERVHGCQIFLGTTYHNGEQCTK
jgi:hypothetical protein